jgi:adenosylhomocysteine nucleosidase
MRLLLFFAFPREIRAAVRLTAKMERIKGLPFRAFHVRHPSHTLIVTETGLGMQNAERAFLRMVCRERPDGVISLGYCGALTPDACEGDLIWASRVCLIGGDARKVEELFLIDDRNVLETLSSRLPLRAGTFLTMKEWMGKEAATRLAPPGVVLPVCEMETFALARLSLRHRLPFFAVRAVSDGADRELAFDPRSVCDAGGTYRTTIAIKSFLTRPRLWTHAMALRRSSKVASRNLALVLRALLQVL